MQKSIDLRDKGEILLPLRLHVPAGTPGKLCKYLHELYGKWFEGKEAAAERITFDSVGLGINCDADLTEEEKRVFESVMFKMCGLQTKPISDASAGSRLVSYDTDKELIVPLRLHVDLREPQHLRELILEMYKKAYPDDWENRIVFGNAFTSDFYFTKLDPDNHSIDTEETYGAIVERASMADCAQKIQSRLFYDQKNRMRMAYDGLKFYVFEGDLSSARDYQQPMLGSARLSTLLGDKFNCVHSANYKCTVNFIMDLHARLERKHEGAFAVDRIQKNNDCDYVDMHKNKREYSRDRQIYANLTNVDGISTLIASAIEQEFESWHKIVAACYAAAEDGDDPHLIFSGIAIKDGRKIGPLTSAKIVDAYEMCKYPHMSCSHSKYCKVSNSNNNNDDDDDRGDRDRHDQERSNNNNNRKKKKQKRQPKQEYEDDS